MAARAPGPSGRAPLRHRRRAEGRGAGSCAFSLSTRPWASAPPALVGQGRGACWLRGCRVLRGAPRAALAEHEMLKRPGALGASCCAAAAPAAPQE